MMSGFTKRLWNKIEATVEELPLTKDAVTHILGFVQNQRLFRANCAILESVVASTAASSYNDNIDTAILYTNSEYDMEDIEMFVRSALVGDKRLLQSYGFDRFGTKYYGELQYFPTRVSEFRSMAVGMLVNRITSKLLQRNVELCYMLGTRGARSTVLRLLPSVGIQKKRRCRRTLFDLAPISFC